MDVRNSERGGEAPGLQGLATRATVCIPCTRVVGKRHGSCIIL